MLAAGVEAWDGKLQVEVGDALSMSEVDRWLRASGLMAASKGNRRLHEIVDKG